MLSSQSQRVLFLGNSYTAANNLPGLLTSLATSGGYSLYTERSTPGGYTLAHPDNGHLYNSNSLGLIGQGRWDYVVLQEQSQFPVIPYYRDNFTYPGSYQLDSIIRVKNECGKTMFYMTWGRKYGGQQCIDTSCSVPFTDYSHMQDSLASAYLNMSNLLETPVSPTGLAWKISIIDYGDPVELFSTDGSHPSLAGSYLTACTFYCAIFHESPEGLGFNGGLDPSIALYLQRVAAETVLSNFDIWNIDTTKVKSDFTYEVVGMEVSFHNHSVNAESYIWDFGDGAASASENPTYTYEEPGIYDVWLVSASGCKVDSAMHSVEVVLTNLETINTENYLYPNPGTGLISIPVSSSFEKADVCILDSRLTPIEDFVAVLQSNHIKFDSRHLKKGIYFIRVSLNNSQTAIYKFVKK